MLFNGCTLADLLRRSRSDGFIRPLFVGPFRQLRPFAGTWCGELFDRAFLAVADAIAPHRSRRVVIGRLRLQAVHACAEYRLRMAPVESDVRFRCLAQLRWVSAVMNDGEMIIRPSGVVGRPSDNDEVVARKFERRALDDLNVPGSLCRRKNATGLVWSVVLGDGRISGEETAKRYGDRQLEARASQNSPPTNAWSVSLKCNTGNCGAYVYRCAVRLPARKWNVPG
jgi:hypothetical protein